LNIPARPPNLLPPPENAENSSQPEVGPEGATPPSSSSAAPMGRELLTAAAVVTIAPAPATPMSAKRARRPGPHCEAAFAMAALSSNSTAFAQFMVPPMVSTLLSSIA